MAFDLLALREVPNMVKAAVSFTSGIFFLMFFYIPSPEWVVVYLSNIFDCCCSSAWLFSLTWKQNSWQNQCSIVKSPLKRREYLSLQITEYGFMDETLYTLWYLAWYCLGRKYTKYVIFLCIYYSRGLCHMMEKNCLIIRRMRSILYISTYKDMETREKVG